MASSENFWKSQTRAARSHHFMSRVEYKTDGLTATKTARGFDSPEPKILK